jgi:hypothetical protein
MDSLRIVPPIIREYSSRIIFPFFGLLAQLGCSPEKEYQALAEHSARTQLTMSEVIRDFIRKLETYS